ncbi:MAG: hypothetical protein PHS86_08595 [Syntrophaceae bacterium]|nr:hypothetical protein [Syntrophaceae bacterium]
MNKGPMVSEKFNLLQKYLNQKVISEKTFADSKYFSDISSKVFKAMSSLPEEFQQLFLGGNRNILFKIVSDPKLPFGMKTVSSGSGRSRIYNVLICEECAEWPENRFLGAILREVGHVIAEIPPEEEWPTIRGQRARFKEFLELQADCRLWRWGLRHYDMAYLVATFPSHWVDRIVADIQKLLEITDSQCSD